MPYASRACALLFAAFLAACATPIEVAEPPAPLPAPVVAKPPVDENARSAQAKAFLAQAETDVQRARSKRALWSKAWEELVAARRAAAESDAQSTIDHSRLASEFAQLGLEQLAYPAVK